jgi:integrase
VRELSKCVCDRTFDDWHLPRNALREIRPVSAQVVSQRPESATPPACSPEERDSFIAHADKLALSETISPSTRRKRLTVADLLAFMAGTGVRINEARSLRWEDVDLDSGAVNINGTKSKASKRSLTLPKMAPRALQAPRGDVRHGRLGVPPAPSPE